MLYLFLKKSKKNLVRSSLQTSKTYYKVKVFKLVEVKKLLTITNFLIVIKKFNST